MFIASVTEMSKPMFYQFPGSLANNDDPWKYLSVKITIDTGTPASSPPIKGDVAVTLAI